MSENLVSTSTMIAFAFVLPSVAAPDESPRVLKVATDGRAEFTSVQAAIDAAPAGAIVQIGPGTFRGPVQIGKPLTLEGAGAEQTMLTTEWITFQELLVDGKGILQENRARYEELRPIAVDQEHGEGPVSAQLWQEFGPKPTLAVKGTKGVVVRGLSASMPGTVWKGGYQSFHMVLLEDAGVTLESCAFVGSAVDGVEIRGRSTASLQDCLIGGIRSSGIVVNVLEEAKVEIDNCDIRGCGYAGVKIKGVGDVTVEGCRISHIEYHGIRYDDTSPTITRNVLSHITRAGIYIDGNTQGTISHNLFLNCATGGRGERIVNNTFVLQPDSAVADQNSGAIVSRGIESQLMQRNVITGYDHALVLFSTDKRPVDRQRKQFQNNLCDTRQSPLVSGHSIEPKSAYQSRSPPEYDDLPLSEGNWMMPVKLSDPENGDYGLSSDVDWPDSNLGAQNHASLTSPWSEPPAERAMRERMQEWAAEGR